MKIGCTTLSTEAQKYLQEKHAEVERLRLQLAAVTAERDRLKTGCEGAARCRASMERDFRPIIDALRTSKDPGIAGAAESTLGAWLRNLSHAVAALANTEGSQP